MPVVIPLGCVCHTCCPFRCQLEQPLFARPVCCSALFGVFGLLLAERPKLRLEPAAERSPVRARHAADVESDGLISWQQVGRRRPTQLESDKLPQLEIAALVGVSGFLWR